MIKISLIDKLLLNDLGRRNIMEICNSFYLVPNNINQKACLEWIDLFFKSRKYNASKDDTITANLPEENKWIKSFLEIKEVKFDIAYKISYKNAKNKIDAGFYLDIRIKYDIEKRKHADALSSLIQDIKKIKKNDFYLIVVEDALSQYYTQISYKSLSDYERNLRKLLLIITAPLEGEEWINSFVTHTSKLNATEKNHIEKGLEELDLADFEKLLFDPIINFTEENYADMFNLNRLEELSKSEIIRVIHDNQPISFWNKYLQNFIKIDNISKRMQNIRNQRNKIAHNKYFSSEDQTTFNNDTKYFSKKIEEAIKEITNHSEKFDTKVMNQSLLSLKKLVNEATKSLLSFKVL